MDVIWERRSKEGTAEVKMNGVQLAKVEDEMLHNMYWLATSCSLWVRLQVPLLGTSLQMKLSATSSHLPVIDTSRSALYQLDFLSGNLSVLKAQEKNGRILFSLASVYGLVERLVCQTGTSPITSLDRPIAHPDKETELLFSTVSAFLSLKSCLNTLPSRRAVLGGGHVQVFLTVASKVLEASVSLTAAQPASHHSQLRDIVVGLQVEAMSLLATIFEVLFAFVLPPPFRPVDHVFERYEMVGAGVELVESNKWPMLMTLQSFDNALEEECFTCRTRSLVKRKVDQLMILVQNCLLASEADQCSRPTTSSHANSSNIGSTGDYGVQHFSASASSRRNTLSSMHYTYDAQPPLLSPRYFSLPYSEIDDMSSQPIFNPFQGSQLMPAAKDYLADGAHEENTTLPSASPTTSKYANDPDWPSISTIPFGISTSQQFMGAPTLPQRMAQTAEAAGVKTEGSLMQHHPDITTLTNSYHQPPSPYLPNDL